MSTTADTSTGSRTRVHPTELLPDPSRVIARLFLPGEGVPATHSRTSEIAARVMALPAERLATLADELIADFSTRHEDVTSLFEHNARAVASRIDAAHPASTAQRIVLGAAFTSEYAVEGAALCNPSAVAHPDQSRLKPGELRVALAMRSIGEGHLSSIGFAEAVIGADGGWTFEERATPLAHATIGEGTWSRAHLHRALEHEGHLTELASAVLGELPPHFAASEVDAVLGGLPQELSRHHESRSNAELLRNMAFSAYEASFAPQSSLSQRVLLPVSAEEDHGMEDARFVRFTADDGTVDYRATYTAYDGRDIAPRLIVSPDLATFSIHRLAGNAARNKGMALFPRTVDGLHLALSRTDGESISLARSTDGMVWDDAGPVHRPIEPWEFVQTGNCGSPIETAAGWIALTHGVGPMRSYSIGALLLDLDDPRKVIGRLTEPLLRPSAQRRDGYVPNVVYSCGGVLHDDTLWIPFGIDDSRVSVYSIALPELLGRMSTLPSHNR